MIYKSEPIRHNKGFNQSLLEHLELVFHFQMSQVHFLFSFFYERGEGLGDTPHPKENI